IPKCLLMTPSRPLIVPASSSTCASCAGLRLPSPQLRGVDLRRSKPVAGPRARGSEANATLLFGPPGTFELIEDRHDLLTAFGIWIHVLSGLEQRQVFGAKFCLQFVYLLGQILGFLAVFLLINLIELITEIEDLAVGLGLSLITSYDTEDR